jgi:hypothetical protein
MIRKKGSGEMLFQSISPDFYVAAQIFVGGRLRAANPLGCAESGRMKRAKRMWRVLGMPRTAILAVSKYCNRRRTQAKCFLRSVMR